MYIHIKFAEPPRCGRTQADAAEARQRRGGRQYTKDNDSNNIHNTTTTTNDNNNNDNKGRGEEAEEAQRRGDAETHACIEIMMITKINLII